MIGFLKCWTTRGILLLLVLVGCNEKNETTNLTQYVDPFIGTGGHGHVFLGANVPFGAVQLGPTQFSQGWDWCSGYHYSDSTIIGFAHTHLSGTGSADMGDISFMPAVGDVKLTRGNLEDETSGIYSKFSHDNEVAEAGYYKVHLDRFNIDAELTATKRVGFHKYAFPASDDSKIIIDLEHGLQDTPVETFIQLENDTVISGFRTSEGWAYHHRTYFAATFSKPIRSFEIFDGNDTHNRKQVHIPNAYGVAGFKTKQGEVVYAKVAISSVSIDNAKLNLQTELNHWDFEKVRSDATEAWNNELAKIQIKTNDEHVKRTFYTSFYHTMIAPSVFSDVNGDYFGTDEKAHYNNSFTTYSTFSLWDTYRTVHPLMNLVHPELVPDIAKTFLSIYNEQGRLPIWHMIGNETFAMVGNPGAVVLADMVLSDFDVDQEAAFEAMKASAMLDERGIDWLKKYGYVPFDKYYSSVANSLEYGLADWSIAQVAKKLGKDDDYMYFINRSKAYKYHFDEKTGFLRPRDSEGNFLTPFTPTKMDGYREGNGWQYLWLVPHDVNGLINLFGSDEAFTEKLDSLFHVNENRHNGPDVTGLIGQYAHGNEPSHHILYLYNYVGQPWKAAEKIRRVLTEQYTDEPDGISGNEDVGQMSAWYIMSSLGFYPVAPANADYILGSPIVDEATLQLRDGKQLHVVVKNNSPENKYIQRVWWNGNAYSKSFVPHKQLMDGGELEFEMGATPSKTFGVKVENRPASFD